MKFKTTIIKSSVYNYRDAYILVHGTITVNTKPDDEGNNTDKKVIFKNYATFTKVANAKDIDLVMAVYSL